MHYRRRCRMVAPCCGEVFWCRHCHNEVKTANEWVRACATQHTFTCILNLRNLALGATRAQPKNTKSQTYS